MPVSRDKPANKNPAAHWRRPGEREAIKNPGTFRLRG
jgi:hypothetical protein